MSFFSDLRRRRMRRAAIPPTWTPCLEEQLYLFRRLSSADRQELLGHMQVFLAEKRPQTLEHAQYSFPHVLAAIVLDGAAGAAEISEEAKRKILGGNFRRLLGF